MVTLSFSANAYTDKRLNLLKRCLLEILFNWFKNNNQLNNLIVYENDIYQWFNLKVLSEYCSCSWRTVQSNISILSNLGLLKKLKTKDNKLYLAFDFEKYKAVLDSKEKLVCERISWIDKYLAEEKNKRIGDIEKYNTEKGNKMDTLLQNKDVGLKAYRCKEADAIARRILKKYSQYFSTRYPKKGEVPTKTYMQLCSRILDIYNGVFEDFAVRNLDNSVFNNKQFDTEGWGKKLAAVAKDWNQVKALIFYAVENFVLMHEKDRMPFDKKWLTTNLNNWFFQYIPGSKGQSQFVQSLKEPQNQKKKLDSNQALKIIAHLKKRCMVSYHAGHELNMLLPQEASELKAWRFIIGIIEWGKLLWKYEKNAKYFMCCTIEGELQTGPKVLPALFARWLKERNIIVSLSTLDIETSSQKNRPWSWFIQDACRNHDMNSNFLRCFDDEDFCNAKKKSSKVTSDDIVGYDFGDVALSVF